MPSYLLIKHLHMTFAVTSGVLFFFRGLLMLRDSSMLQARLLRIVPHVVDTALLASAFMLVFVSGQYPFAQNWLTAKVVALLVYIGLGTVALKRGKSKPVRVMAFAAALLVFFYIVKVAVTKQVFM
jgi:uncharacterized membrane protein SirB2